MSEINQTVAVGDGRENFTISPAKEPSTLFYFFGQLLGLAVRSGIELPLDLAPLVWKRLIWQEYRVDFKSESI